MQFVVYFFIFILNFIRIKHLSQVMGTDIISFSKALCFIFISLLHASTFLLVVSLSET